MQTPSTHRQRLAPGNGYAPRVGGMNNVQPNTMAGTPMPGRTSSGRSPMATINNNSGFAGYGMSAGLKVSNPAITTANSFPRPVVRSRGSVAISFEVFIY